MYRLLRDVHLFIMPNIFVFIVLFDASCRNESKRATLRRCTLWACSGYTAAWSYACMRRFAQVSLDVQKAAPSLCSYVHHRAHPRMLCYSARDEQSTAAASHTTVPTRSACVCVRITASNLRFTFLLLLHLHHLHLAPLKRSCVPHMSQLHGARLDALAE